MRNGRSPRRARVHLESRRGGYAIIFAFALVLLLGFGALAVDVAYVRLAQMQTQDIADAASQAALYRLRRTGDLDDARTAAQNVVELNMVGSNPPEIESLTFGVWDHTLDPPTFTETETRPNAVRVRVARAGDNALSLFLARLFGFDEANIVREATSATRALHVVLVMDITGSWSQRDFSNARAASLAFLDVLESSYGEYDMFGMSIFTGRFAYEYTAMRYLEDEDFSPIARNAWGKLNVASKGGKGKSFPSECTLHDDTPVGRNSKRNKFVTPVGGCYPDMPREYTDEPGTDHTTGINMAKRMFEEEVDPTAFRAMVVLTDGKPNGLSAAHGRYRRELGYTETRWREYLGPVPHSTAQVKTESNALTAEMYEEMGVNTWVVSFVADDSFMETMPKGIGYYANTSDSEALIPIFENIANSLPMAIVQ